MTISFKTKNKASRNALHYHFKGDYITFKINKTQDGIDLIDESTKSIVNLEVNMKDVMLTTNHEQYVSYSSLNPIYDKLLGTNVGEIMDSPNNTGCIYDKDFITLKATILLNKMSEAELTSFLNKVKVYFTNITIADQELISGEKDIVSYYILKPGTRAVISIATTARIKDKSIIDLINIKNDIEKQLYTKMVGCGILEEKNNE